MTDKNLHLKNLKLLWWLRNVAIVGQAAAIVIVTKILEIPLMEKPLWLIVEFLAVVNFVTWLRIKRAPHIEESEFFCQMLIDIGALFCLLYFTGGASNPFASLFILQVIIAAITFSPLYTWIVAILTVGLYTALVFWNVEVPYFLHHHINDFFSLHVQAMWINFILLAGIISWFVVRMNVTIKRQDLLLAESEKIAAIGTLAANSAHELGTPLATLAILAEDYVRDLTKDERIKKAAMFTEQLSRCKQIISNIAAAGGVVRAEGGKAMRIDLFFNDLLAQWKKANPAINLTQELSNNKTSPLILAEIGFSHAIINLLDNAADASPDHVHLKAEWTAKNIVITIEDKGEGIPPEISENFGKLGNSSKVDGLGMGLFLSKSVIVRLGGTLDIQSKSGKGTVAKIQLPIARIEI